MILDHGMIYSAITNRTSLKELFKGSGMGSFSDYIIKDYVMTEHIPAVHVNGSETKTAKLLPADFYPQHQYFSSLDLHNILINYRYHGEYSKRKKFKQEFLIHFFDTFILIELIPGSLETEFLMLAPDIEVGDDQLQDRLMGMLAASSVSSLYLSISPDPSAIIGFYLKLGELLDILETGRKRKKFLGLF